MVTSVSQNKNQANVRLEKELSALWSDLSESSKTTIPYENVPEILKKLDDLEQVLAGLEKLNVDHIDMVKKQLKDEILTVYLYMHPEVDVRVTLGACLSKVFRILAPVRPFEDENMEIFFRLANKAYEFLPYMAGRAYTKALTILKMVAEHNAHRIMLDEDLYDLVCEMFQLFLDGIRSDHPAGVCSTLEYIMSQTILDCEDCNGFVVYLIKILLSSLKKENQDANPVAFELARDVFRKCDKIITTYILDATKHPGISVEHYDGIVAYFCRNATRSGLVDNEVGEVDASQHARGESSNQPLDSHSPRPEQKTNSSLHDIPAMATSPLSTNVSSERGAQLGRVSGQERRKTRVRKIGETSSSLSGTVSSNAETELSDRQQGKKDDKNSGELSNSQSRSMYQGFRFGEVPNSLEQNRNARANDKDPHTLLSLLANVSLDGEARLEKVHDLQDQKNYVNAAVESSSSKGKELAINEEGGMDTFVFGRDLRGDIRTKALGSTSRASSSKLKAKRLKSSNQEVKREDAPALQEVPENSGRPGPELVGSRIKVMWPKEDFAFFEGTVISYNPRNRKHWVYYDDGDWENLDLLKEIWLYLG